ncbi:aminodeoxychorismate lyase [Marinobacter sp. 71-i]|uniref:Aminodeoxychorismate lyase n=1 Tax=Marinobacter iranensis TaxID=2962607 RepID=A0ABT5Y6G4_9GAMM|nr:aminodeoxychorismate lyase [Marinobacter iranensis]MDF0749149.1 aminodeoxychorismate lyase [Marinobacter iranensis]
MLNIIHPDSAGVPAADRGLAYGDGLFETIRMRGRKAVLRSLHLDRMVADAGRLGIPVRRDDLDAEITRSGREAARRYGSDDWVLKLVLTRGVGGRGYRLPAECEPSLIVTSSAMPALPDPVGVVVALAQFPLTVNPRLAGIKTLNRLEQVMASSEFSGEEFELIMADTDGNLVEGTRTNLFVRLENEWITPPVQGLAVAGVMRQYALKCLRAAGHKVREQAIPPSLLSSPGLRGLYVLNSVIGVAPVRRMDGVDLPVDDGLETICDPLQTLE